MIGLQTQLAQPELASIHFDVRPVRASALRTTQLHNLRGKSRRKFQLPVAEVNAAQTTDATATNAVAAVPELNQVCKLCCAKLEHL